jgi:kynurenine formamidase
MRIRSFIIAYALVLALLLFADRRPVSPQQNRYSQVIDLTDSGAAQPRKNVSVQSGTRIISPAAMIPGTWAAGQIPPERLIAPLVVMNLKTAPQITLEDIDGWESRNGAIPQGAIIAIRHDSGNNPQQESTMPITPRAAQFLMDARYALGFAIETPADLTSDRVLARQLALHGAYVVEGATRMTSLPEAGSLVIVAPAKSKNAPEAPVRVLAMVR